MALTYSRSGRARALVTATVVVVGVAAIVAVAPATGLNAGAGPRAPIVAAIVMPTAAPVSGSTNDQAQAVSTPNARPRASAAWVASVSTATGIGAVALQAYADATVTLHADDPSCRLGWTTIAAIGWIESGHGTHGGALLLDDGRTDIPILGPALDGRNGFAAIPATPDATAWHGDPVWDHAVGPLQFLPSTWRRWGADGDGDGVADPNDVDDAALAAGRYLCASGSDLRVAVAWRDAVFSYNHSDAYVSEVRGAANRYAASARAVAL